MKLNDVKHNHSLTDLLKVLLFAIVMLLPFIDVAVRCLYVIANKNAYQSYSDVETIAYTQVNSVNYIEGMEYQVRYNREGTNTAYQYNYVKDGKTNINELYLTTPYKEKTIDRWTIEQGTTLYCYFTDNSYYGVVNWFNTSNVFNFVADSETITIDTTNRYYKVYRMDYTYSTLDNVFEYSVSRLEESQLYNWTIQTAIYSGVSQMTGQLGITTNIIPIIICYWFFITIIYIILDIVIRLFTILTHFIGSKTTN